MLLFMLLFHLFILLSHLLLLPLNLTTEGIVVKPLQNLRLLHSRLLTHCI